MKFLNLKSKENSKDFSVYFMILDKLENPVKLRVDLVKKEDGKYLFAGDIYREDLRQKTVYDKYVKRNTNKMNFIIPNIYYNKEVTSFLISSLFNDIYFKNSLKENEVKISSMLFNKESLIERENNVKKLIKLAIDREEKIAVVGKNGDFYIPFQQLGIGNNLEQSLPGGSEYEKIMEYKMHFGDLGDFDRAISKQENLIKERFERASKNVYSIKLESSVGKIVLKNGRVVGFYDMHPMGMKLAQETCYFDELTFDEMLFTLSKNMFVENYFNNDFLYDFNEMKEIFELISITDKNLFEYKRMDFEVKKDLIFEELFNDIGVFV